MLIDEHANTDANWTDSSKIWSKYAHIGAVTAGATSFGATSHTTSAMGTGSTDNGYYVTMPVGATMKLGADTETETDDVVVTGVTAGASNAMTFTHNASSGTVEDHSQIFHKLEAGHQNFTRKGFFGYHNYTASTTSDNAPHKRENIAASCRVKEIIQTGVTTFDVVVDNVGIFLNNDDTRYCAFKYADVDPSFAYFNNCTLYNSDTTDDLTCVDPHGRLILTI